MSKSTTSTPPSVQEVELVDFEPPASFTDTYFFPAFAQLQSEYHLGQPIYEEGETWCLLAEIDAASTSAGNPFCLVCHDRNGDNFIVGFDLSKGLRFTPSQFKVGYTIAIVYAKRVNFVDGTKGIRVADLAICHAFPHKLERLLEMNKTLCDYWETLDEEGRTRVCFGCNEEKRDLKECPDCPWYYYCNKGCQKLGEDRNRHSRDCEILRDRNFSTLLKINTREATDESRFEFLR
ncbi:hypothetical protein CkaCkLH20_09336 [Colletotrichum karsti]|uniref:MYND-type domain-containing protein n=1 Tax=Colletotrichum karsti TaxID=1095194 RepID=A0A9P6HX96_9PEZI|nr:uncharacterized protein CkaCkLH20_09336 [Colletotrichum karsti]KAF9873173.1 hypothetical protein CkaCkLH20_09336 [Colletotrichum karsti]